MKNHQGSVALTIIGIITILAIGGGIAYVVTRPSKDVSFEVNQEEQVRLRETTQAPVQTQSKTTTITTTTASSNPSAGNSGAQQLSIQNNDNCLTVTSLNQGQSAIISFPLTIQGTVNSLGCWAFFEGEGGMVSIIHNGQDVTPESVDHLIKVQGPYYEALDYPVPFSATIQNVPNSVTGPALLQFDEKGPFGEDGMPPSRLPKSVSIPIIIQ
jgi:hypothetical protein